MKKRWDAIIERLDLSKPIKGAEIGIWHGQMSEQLLRALPQLHLTMVDRWCPTPTGDSYFDGSIKISRMGRHEFENAYNDTIKRTQSFHDRISILVMHSVQAAEVIKDKSLDFCFIDADHSFKGVCADINAWHDKVKPGGWLCGHDWENNHGDVKGAVTLMLGANIEISYNKTWFFRVE